MRIKPIKGNTNEFFLKDDERNYIYGKVMLVPAENQYVFVPHCMALRPNILSEICDILQKTNKCLTCVVKDICEGDCISD